MTDELPGAGPAMDALVREALLSDDRLGLENDWWAEHPSTSTPDAIWALEAWREQHEDWRPFRMGWNYASDRMELGQHNVYIGGISVFAPTLAQAICEAIIRAQWAMEDAE